MARIPEGNYRLFKTVESTEDPNTKATHEVVAIVGSDGIQDDLWGNQVAYLRRIYRVHMRNGLPEQAFLITTAEWPYRYSDPYSLNSLTVDADVPIRSCLSLDVAGLVMTPKTQIDDKIAREVLQVQYIL